MVLFFRTWVSIFKAVIQFLFTLIFIPLSLMYLWTRAVYCKWTPSFIISIFTIAMMPGLLPVTTTPLPSFLSLRARFIFIPVVNLLYDLSLFTFTSIPDCRPQITLIKLERTWHKKLWCEIVNNRFYTLTETFTHMYENNVLRCVKYKA